MLILRESVSSRPLFAWFAQDKAHRRKLREAGYRDATITNWKHRGVPRAEVGNIASLMGISYEQYIELANVGKEWRQVAVLAFLSLALSFAPTDATSHNYFSASQSSPKPLSFYTFYYFQKLLDCFAKLFRNGQSAVVKALQRIRLHAVFGEGYRCTGCLHP